MGRGITTGAAPRYRLGDALPAMFYDDPFIQSFCDGLDEVLAPVPAALDNFFAFLDPRLTPDDFLEWLAGWVGVETDHTWSEQRRRAMVIQAAELYRWRGTVGGLADLIELFVGVRPEIVEGGAVAWSQTPETTMPGDSDVALVVRLDMPQLDPATLSKLDTLIAANKPAHVTHAVEFTAKPKTPKTPKAPKDQSAPPPDEPETSQAADTSPPPPPPLPSPPEEQA